jgi:hexosaminidase
VFYGAQTVLQMLRSRPGDATLPRGSARDWPTQRERGLLLDAGRKYYSPDFIVQTIREMSYLKLNTLQLHLSDNNAFRLVSERFPYLAAPQAYTRADIASFEAAAHRYHVTITPRSRCPRTPERSPARDPIWASTARRWAIRRSTSPNPKCASSRPT